MTAESKKIIATIALMGYMFLAFFGLVGLSSHMSHSGMPMPDCPYALGTHSLCSMDGLGHIEGWEAAMRTLLPSFMLIVALIAAISLFSYRELDIGPPTYLRRRPERQYSPYVALFARGLLNPKIP